MKFNLVILISLLIASGTYASELERLAEADQRARSGVPEAIDWSALAKEDQARRDRVQVILAEERIFSADEYFSAALIMQH